MNEFIKAWQIPAYRTVYEDKDGNLTVREGGDANWRNSNPGNLKYGDFSVRHGAIGSMKPDIQSSFDSFAIFPDTKTGENAFISLIDNNYLDKSLATAIKDYSPLKDNKNANISGKVKDISGKLGVSSDTVVRSLGPEGIKKFKALLRRYEAPEKPGKEYSFAAGTLENEALRKEKILHYHYAKRLPPDELQKEENLNALFRSSDYIPQKIKPEDKNKWEKRRKNMHSLVRETLQTINGSPAAEIDATGRMKQTPPLPPRKPDCLVSVRAYNRESGKERVRPHTRSCPRE